MEELKGVMELFYLVMRNMPEKARIAIAWLIKNQDFLEESLTIGPKTAEEREICLKAAWAEEDYMLWVLLLYQKFKQEHPENLYAESM